MTDILQAARSYYGLADTESCTTQLFTNQAGQACVAFEIPLSSEDFIAIGERMKAMQLAECHEAEQVSVFGEDLDTHAMRQQYNALSKAERGKYGSFGKYMSAISNGIIDAPEAEEPTTMDAVWMDGRDIENWQVAYASDHDKEKNLYLVQSIMLTGEQKQKAKERL